MANGWRYYLGNMPGLFLHPCQWIVKSTNLSLKQRQNHNRQYILISFHTFFYGNLNNTCCIQTVILRVMPLFQQKNFFTGKKLLAILRAAFCLSVRPCTRLFIGLKHKIFFNYVKGRQIGGLFQTGFHVFLWKLHKFIGFVFTRLA